MISWKRKVDNLAELDINYKKFKIMTIYDTYDNFPAQIYPGFILNITANRNPSSKLVKYLLPCITIKMCIICTF